MDNPGPGLATLMSSLIRKATLPGCQTGLTLFCVLPRLAEVLECAAVTCPSI